LASVERRLLKLGITVSERTVSRYLPDRTRRPSQTWRTFLVNHFGDLTLPSSLASSGERGEDDVVDIGVRPLPSTPMSVDAMARLRTVGGRRQVCFGPTHVFGLAGSSRRPSPPNIYTPELG
jgi:hypothetical protein